MKQAIRFLLLGAILLLYRPADSLGQEGPVFQYRPQQRPAFPKTDSGQRAVRDSLAPAARPCLPTYNEDLFLPTTKLLGAGKFSVYEPNYFLSASNKNDFGQVKFKISFQYDLGWPFASRATAGQQNRLCFAYTQQSFWDLYSASSPMRDVNFEPMLHWEHTLRQKVPDDSGTGRWIAAFNDYKLGALHESNGQEGEANRSLFKFYAHGTFSFTHEVGNCRFGLKRIVFRPSLWTWIGLADDNRDIAAYRGYGQLITSFLFDYHNIRRIAGMYPLEVSHILIPAVHTSSVISIIFNPFLLKKYADWVPNIYLQHWYGYGESLLNYDNRFYGYRPQNTFRAGIQFRFQ